MNTMSERRSLSGSQDDVRSGLGKRKVFIFFIVASVAWHLCWCIGNIGACHDINYQHYSRPRWVRFPGRELDFFCCFFPVRVPLAAFSAETRRLSRTSCSVPAIESFNHRSQVKPLRPVGIHRSWSTASFDNCAESALPEVGIHGQTRHQCHRRPWSRRPWPRSNGKLNYRSRNVPTRRHEIVSNVDRLRRFGTAAQLGLHHRRG